MKESSFYLRERGRDLHVVRVAVTYKHFANYAILGARWSGIRVANSRLRATRVVHEEAVRLAKILVGRQTFRCHSG